jgi:hypothetical protein
MKRILTLLLFSCAFAPVIAQKSFEGEVVYSVSVKSNTPNTTTERLAGLVGTIQHYYMKGGNYKNTFNGTAGEWQICLSKNKKLYFKVLGRDTIYWQDVRVNPDTLYKTELKKNDTTILGYKCDKLIFTCSTGIQVYYFNNQFSVDPNLYTSVKYSNWYAFLEKARSIALKEIFYEKFYTITLTATSIQRRMLDDTIFKLPEGIPIVENPAK